MGYLSTHVLDTSRGQPASGVVWTLYKVTLKREKIGSGITNSDGRTDQPLLDASSFRRGVYEITFEVAKYFSELGGHSDSQPFLDVIPIRFRISDDHTDYHIPLLVSPYGYSTYRGS